MNPAPRVIDAHVHVASMHFTPTEFVSGIARNMAVAAAATTRVPLGEAQITRLLIAENQDHDADDLVRQMDESSVTQAVLLAPDFSHTFTMPMSIEDIARAHHAIRLRHPNRFFVFLGYDPRSGQRGLDSFENSIRSYRFEGLKLYPPCGFSPSDPRLFPVYELCASLGLPVLIHTGPTSPALSFEFSYPQLIDAAAKAFPTVNFILAHGGVNYVEEATLLCAYRPNVYLDIAAFPAVLSEDGWEAHLARLFRLSINHKIIFGTDWPVCRHSGSYAMQVQKLCAPDGPLGGSAPRDQHNVLFGNILRLLKSR